MSLYDRVAARPGGNRALASARLKRAILGSLHQAFARSGMESQSDLARRLGVRRSAVNQVFNGDGNLRITTVAEYLYEMGYELNVTIVKAGEPRAAAIEGRDVQPAFPDTGTSPASTLYFRSSPQTLIEQPTASHMIVRVTMASESPHPVVVRSWPLEAAQEPLSRSLATPTRIGIPGGSA